MALDINASLEAAKNILESDAIFNLYEVQVQASPIVYEYWAGYNASVTYFKPGTVTPQVYSPYPIKRGTIKQDDGTSVPSLNIGVGAVDQQILAYLESQDALRRNRIRCITVPMVTIGNATACVIDTFYIDGAVVDHGIQEAVLELTDKGQVADVTVPLRRMRRDHCSYKYNASDCRGSTEAGARLAPFADRVCKHIKSDCASKDNVINFGAFPGIGTKQVVF